jgi:hypothetical protein
MVKHDCPADKKPKPEIAVLRNVPTYFDEDVPNVGDSRDYDDIQKSEHIMSSGPARTVEGEIDGSVAPSGGFFGPWTSPSQQFSHTSPVAPLQGTNTAASLDFHPPIRYDESTHHQLQSYRSAILSEDDFTNTAHVANGPASTALPFDISFQSCPYPASYASNREHDMGDPLGYLPICDNNDIITSINGYGNPLFSSGGS